MPGGGAELCRMFVKNATDTNFTAAGPMRSSQTEVIAHEGPECRPQRVIVRGPPSSIGGTIITGAEVNELVGEIVVPEPRPSAVAVRP